MNNETTTANSPEQITPKISAMIFNGVMWSGWSNYKGESQIASLNDAVSKIKNNPECGYYIIDADKAVFQFFNNYADLPEMIIETHNHCKRPKHLIGPATPRTGPKIGRNEACGCGSGKKAKKCCLK